MVAPRLSGRESAGRQNAPGASILELLGAKAGSYATNPEEPAMRRALPQFSAFAVTCLLGLSSLPSAALAAGGHPRLLLGEADVPALREKVKTEPYASMLAMIQMNAEDVTEDNADGTSGAYSDSHVAVKCAFLYQITGDAAWAQKARDHVQARFDDKAKKWADPGLKGLTSYMQAKGVALAYDLAYDAWDPAFRTLVSQRLYDMAEMLLTNGGTEQNTDPASNWQANRFSAAALAYLASDHALDEAKLTTSHGKLTRYLTDNLGTGAAARGWNIEGLGYTYYPWGFVGPAGIALARHNPSLDIRTTVPAVGYALWSAYATVSTISPNIHPDFGDDNNRSRGEGTYGLAFWSSLPALQPGLSYWYERLEGGLGSKQWDSARAGTLYSILFHPGSSVAPADPLSLPEWRSGFDDRDGNGYFTFRNRYRDSGDMVAQLYAKLRGNKGHNGPDSVSFRILGAGNAWAIGGGRYGTGNVYYSSQDTLYASDPDGPLKSNGNSGAFIAGDFPQSGGGFVVASMTESNLGVAAHKRRFLAEYSGGSGVEAVYVIADSSDNGKYWQLVTTPGNAITATATGFDIAGVDGASLRATVVYGAGDHATKIGKRARGSSFSFGAQEYLENNYVHTQSSDGKHLVVLTVAKAGQTQPVVTASGQGILQKLEIGTLKIEVQEDGFVVTGNEAPPIGGGASTGGSSGTGGAVGSGGNSGSGASAQGATGAGASAGGSGNGASQNSNADAAADDGSGGCSCALPSTRRPGFLAVFAALALVSAADLRRKQRPRV